MFWHEVILAVIFPASFIVVSLVLLWLADQFHKIMD